MRAGARLAWGAWALLLGVGCANVNCRTLREQNGEPSPRAVTENDPMKETPLVDRVKVFKPDGSLQCNQGKAIPLAEMRQELGDIKVHQASQRNDGLMRIQKCGTPTGQCNVFEIDRAQLDAALKRGFQEWTFD